MRLIYAQGFSKNEKEEWRAIIFSNILSAFRQIMEAMDELSIEFDSSFDTVSLHYKLAVFGHACDCIA